MGVTLFGVIGSVTLQRTIAGSGSVAEACLPVEALAAIVRVAKGPIKFQRVSDRLVRVTASDLSDMPKTWDLAAESTEAFADTSPPGRGVQVGRDFLAALRAASRVASRESHHRYGYHRVLLDGAIGRVVASDGSVLLLQGGFEWMPRRTAFAPALRVWDAKFWDGPDLAVAWNRERIEVATGEWRVIWPADADVKFPNYDELLARLRSPVARIALDGADADRWLQFLDELVAVPETADEVTVTFADPPALAEVGGAARRVPATQSHFGGRRSVSVKTSIRTLRLALSFGFRSVGVVGRGHPLVALDGPRRFVWATLDSTPVAGSIRPKSTSDTTTTQPERVP